MYYTRKLISLSIFLVVKWGQSSPRRSSDSTCTLAAVIYGWLCAEIKLQPPYLKHAGTVLQAETAGQPL